MEYRFAQYTTITEPNVLICCVCVCVACDQEVKDIQGVMRVLSQRTAGDPGGQTLLVLL